MRVVRILSLGLVLAALTVQLAVAGPIGQSVVPPIPYKLLPGSQLLVYPVGSPGTPIVVPIEGKFLLNPVDVSSEGIQSFEVKDFWFRSTGTSPSLYEGKGAGKYVLYNGGNAGTSAPWQQMVLQVTINRCGLVQFDSGRVPVPPDGQFPRINIKLSQVSPAGSCRLRFALHLIAAPAANFEDTGVLVQGVECVLFDADHGGLYVLDNYGGFSVGDRVWVSGILDPQCVTICMQGDGCIRYNVITKAPY